MDKAARQAYNAAHYQAHKSEKQKRVLEPNERDIVAVDGEGENIPRFFYHTDDNVIESTKRIPAMERTANYSAQGHIYTMLCSSLGNAVESKQGLSTAECFEFLLSLGKANRIIVAYAFQYDINMILRDLPEKKLKGLHKFGFDDWGEYKIHWIPRKSFTVRRGNKSITIWDIFGYFQCSFVQALRQWNVGDKSMVDAIAEMKMKRGEFDKQSAKSVSNYCFDECRLCVDLIRKLLACCYSVGIVPRRYDGAGSIAAAILQKYKVADYIQTSEIDESRGLDAYFGGRFEMRTPGIYETCYTYDINSAYPSALLTVPCLTHSSWINRVPSESELGLIKCKWNIAKRWNTDNPPDVAREYGPLPHRSTNGGITYPARGVGWYWAHEFRAAELLFPGCFSVLDGYTLLTECDHKPFGHLSELYEQRKALKDRGDLGHLILKLGYNSEYGKTAQALGGGKGRKPKYRNWLIASYTTSHCRAKLLHAIRLSAGGIVSIATDGVISTKKIEGLTVGMGLGEWEYGQISNVFLVRPNLYAYTENGKREIKCGGLNKYETPLDDLQAGFLHYGPSAQFSVSLKRFVGLGMALSRGILDSGWRCWTTEKRIIAPTQHNRWHLSDPDNGPYQTLPTAMFLGSYKVSHSFTPKGNWGESFESKDDIQAFLDSME